MSTVNALVITPAGDVNREQLPTGYPAFNRSFLGDGFVQAINIDHEGQLVTFWFDEEGKYKDLAPNPLATNLWYALGGQLHPGDYLAGPVAVTGSTPDGELADVPGVVVLQATSERER